MLETEAHTLSAKHPISLTWIVLACLLAICSFIYCQNLGSLHITTWDEVVHVNVVKNLTAHCCVPRLHSSEGLGIDYKEWTNNAVWLHKPLLPFYASATSYALLGKSLFALRLPGAVFALLTVMQIFFIGRRFISNRAGIVAAAIFGLSPYTNELVHGRQFAGFPDLALTFFLTIALYMILQWTETRSDGSMWWLGASVGMAYLSKGGLALAPFAILALLVLMSKETRNFKMWLQSLTVFSLIVFPFNLFWLRRFPTEARYENYQQLQHLVQVVDWIPLPWYAYIAAFLPDEVTWPLVPWAYFAVAWGLTQFRKNRYASVLVLWILAYVIPLSFAVTRIENFVFPVVPAIALLIAGMVEELLEHRQLRILLSLSAASIMGCLLLPVMSYRSHPNRLALIAEPAVFMLSLAMLWIVDSELKRVSKIALIVAASASLLACVVKDLKNNRTGDVAGEAKLRATGLELRNSVEMNGLVLAHNDSVELAELYLMYWSERDVLDVCRSQDPSRTLEQLRNRGNLYLITNASLPAPRAARVNGDNLYSLQRVEADVWIPAVIKTCSKDNPGNLPPN